MFGSMKSARKSNSVTRAKDETTIRATPNNTRKKSLALQGLVQRDNGSNAKAVRKTFTCTPSQRFLKE
jgi:hypothetical protein